MEIALRGGAARSESVVELPMVTRFQGLFILTGLALIIVGLNNQFPLVIVGGSLIGLAILGRLRGS